MFSETSCADVLCDPLMVQVRRREEINDLGKLASQVESLIAMTTGDLFTHEVVESLKVGETDYENWKFPLEIGIDYLSVGETIHRNQLKDLVEAIRAFIETPSLQNEMLVPLSYKERVFLVNLNSVVDNDHKEVCKAIDKGDLSPMKISNAFEIYREIFELETNSTYPFKFFPQPSREVEKIEPVE